MDPSSWERRLGKNLHERIRSWWKMEWAPPCAARFFLICRDAWRAYEAGDQNAVPPGERQRFPSTMVDVWLDVESQKFDPIMSVIAFQCFIVPIFIGGTTDHKIVEESLEKLKDVFQVYEARLSKFKYLAGDFISLADLSHSPMLHYLLATPHAPVLSRYPHVKSWISGIMDRPSVKKIT
jgi:glutathione S-transferase